MGRGRRAYHGRVRANDFDVIVIGAGIAGASVAAHLALHRRVLLLEREAQPGYHTTGRSAAMFIESYGPLQVRALTRASRRWFDATPGLLEPRGTLYISNDEQRASIEALQAELGSAVRPLDTRQALARVPVLRPEAAALALYEAGACDIDVHAVHQQFLRGVREQGSVLRSGSAIEALHCDGMRWTVHAADGAAWRAPVVVNAAGAWADEVGRLAGARPIGVQPRRRSAFTFAPPAHVDVRGWPAVIAADESFYFKPDAGVLLGSPANADPVAPHDVVAEELDIATGIAAIEAATTMTIRRPLRTWAGLRSFVPDGGLVGGFDDALPGFFWCAGQGGYGIQSSPAMGAACAARILGQALPPFIADQGLSFDDLRCRR